MIGLGAVICVYSYVPLDEVRCVYLYIPQTGKLQISALLAVNYEFNLQ